MTDKGTATPIDSQSVVDFLNDKARRPLSLQSLASELGLEDDRHEELQSVLAELVAAGTVVENRGGRYGVPAKMNLVVGRLSAHPDGYGFVVSEDEQDDLFVPGRFMADALDGDRVVARIEHRRRSGKLDGRVIRVLERSRTTLVGTMQRSRGGWWVEPLDPKVGTSVHVAADDRQEAGEGKVVHVEITEYPKQGRAPEGRVLEVLGEQDDPKIDVEIVIREYELASEFPKEVLDEARAIATQVTAAEIDGRTDFRDLPIITIDGESAKDFDDAVHVEILPTGNYRLHVHIADVSHYVAGGSALDQEARRRATSVYFPGHVLPMLPESISNEICSLKPGVDRLTQSILIDVDRTGKTVNYELHDGVIKSAARMTYKQVAGVLAGDDEKLIDELEDHRLQFERMRELAEILMDYRRRRGSIDFDLPEPEVVINLRGETEDIVKSERNIAHRIIEEFMIRANEVVASHLTWEDMGALYRVHEGPDPERVETFRDFISGLGHRLNGGPEPKPQHFMELIERIEGRPEERVVTTLMLRTMKQARYQTDNEGHFGLASPMYTHFTSPIRRYPDLVIHRLLRAERGSEEAAEFDVQDLQAQLDTICGQCSDRERVAEQAEREYCGWKKVQFMADKLGEEYEGHVTGVKSFGFFVELDPVFVEGLVPVSTLNDDYYRYDEAKHRLVGENTKRAIALGDRVKVKVVKVDLLRRRLDFQLEEGPLELPAPPVERSRRGRKRRRRKSGEGSPQQDRPAEKAAKGDDSGGREQSVQEASNDEKSKASRGGRKRSRRRRRSRGRGRSGSQQGSQAKGGDGGQQDKPADKQADKKSDKQAQQQDKQASGGDRGKSSRGKGGERRSRSRGGDRNDRNNRRSSRGKGAQRRGQRDSGPTVKPAPQRAESPTQKEEPKSDRPKVNPYLTEIDY